MSRLALMKLKRLRAGLLLLALVIWPDSAAHSQLTLLPAPEHMCAGLPGQLCIRTIEDAPQTLQVTVSLASQNGGLATSPTAAPELSLSGEKLPLVAGPEAQIMPIDLLIIIEQSGQIPAPIFEQFKRSATNLLAVVYEIPGSRAAVLGYQEKDDFGLTDTFLGRAESTSQLQGLIRAEAMSSYLPLFNAAMAGVHQHVDAARNYNHSRHIVLVTDGNDGMELERLPSLYKMLQAGADRQRIMFHPMIVAQVKPRDWWQSLAQQTGGVLGEKVHSEAQVSKFVDDVIARIRSERRLSFSLPRELSPTARQGRFLLRQGSLSLPFVHPISPAAGHGTSLLPILLAGLTVIFAVLLGVLAKKAQGSAGGALSVGNGTGATGLVNGRGANPLLAAYALPQPLTAMGRVRDLTSRLFKLRGTEAIAWLVAADGVLCNKSYPIHKRPYSIGSDPSCSLIIQQPAGGEGRWVIEKIPGDRGVGGRGPSCWVIRCENKDAPIYVGGQAHNLSYALTDQKRFTVGNRTFVFLEELLN